MANNVYIGARYVPNFDGDWVNNKNYEALTIVNYGGSSYTSKKPVPAGTLPTNTNYWAQTGNYNGQISNLQDQINQINNDITLINSDLSNKTDSVTSRYFAFIADSYNTHTKTWGDETASALGLSADHYTKYGVSGASFANGNANASVLGCIANSSIDVNKITDVVMGFGANEMYNFSSDADITTGITTATNSIRNGFPNVERIYLAFIGNDRNRVSADYINNGINARVLNDYREGCNSNKIIFIPNIQYIMHDYRLLTNSDLLHPTDAGYKRLGQATAAFIANGSFDEDKWERLTSSWTALSDVSLDREVRCYVSRHNEDTCLRFENILINLTNPWTTSDKIDLLTLPHGLISGTLNTGDVYLGHLSVNLLDSTNVWHEIDCALIVSETTDLDNINRPVLGLIATGSDILTGSRIIIRTQETHISTLVC